MLLLLLLSFTDGCCICYVGALKSKMRNRKVIFIHNFSTNDYDTRLCCANMMLKIQFFILF